MQDADTVQWLSSVPWPYYRRDADEFVARLAGKEDFAVEVDGNFAGVIRTGDETGYWLMAKYRGRGIMRRAAQAAIITHFLKSDDGLGATYIEGNEPSKRTLHGLGFCDLGSRSITRRYDGATLPGRYLSLTREQFVSALAITTSYGCLRPLSPADLPEIHHIVTRPDVARMLKRFSPQQSLQDIKAIPGPEMNPLQRPMRLGIHHRGACIGSIGLGHGSVPEIFYFLVPEMTGQGIASETVPEFCETVQDWFDLNKLSANVFCDNPASRRVLEKAGFRMVKTQKMCSAGRKIPGSGWYMVKG